MKNKGLALLAALWILAGSLAASSLLMTSARVKWSAAYHAKQRAEASLGAMRLDEQVQQALTQAVEVTPEDVWPPQPDPLQALLADGSVASVRWMDDGVRLLIQVNREDVDVRWPRYYLRP